VSCDRLTGGLLSSWIVPVPITDVSGSLLLTPPFCASAKVDESARTEINTSVAVFMGFPFPAGLGETRLSGDCSQTSAARYRFFHPPRCPGAPPVERGAGPNSGPDWRESVGWKMRLSGPMSSSEGLCGLVRSGR
jgi:hypothetical protein